MLRWVGSKYANTSAGKVRRDLLENHHCALSEDFITRMSQDLGSQIEDLEGSWAYTLPPQAIAAQTISIGRDGTTMFIRGDAYRETMNGTISFYDVTGQRVDSLYLAQAPEYGKASFDQRMEREIAVVKALVPRANYVGVADGAVDNWSFLDQHVEVSILDFFHVCEYITKASKTASRSQYEQQQWRQKAREQLKTKANAALDLLEEMKAFRRKKRLSESAKQGLKSAITYFENHAHQMDYVNYQEQGFPIGSGVTEAACKVVVKQRMCCSGMKWNIPTAQNILTIRTLYLTEERWEQFWNHIDRFGFSDN